MHSLHSYLAIALLALASSAAAESTAIPPDLSGFWNLDMKQPEPDKKLVAQLPPGTVLLADTGAPEFPQGDYGGLKPTAEALESAARWQPSDEMTLSRVCAAPSIIYTAQGPFPFEIHQTPQLIVFKYEYFDQVRLVFMDGRDPLPADAPHSKVGYSTGHWENDELVIETTHLSPATLTNNGLDHTANVRLIERYKLGSDGSTLIATQWFEDKEAIENTGARFIQWRKSPGQHVYPYDCDPSLALEYQGTESEK